MKIEITEKNSTHYTVSVEVNAFNSRFPEKGPMISVSASNVEAWLLKQGIEDVTRVDGAPVQNWQCRCSGIFLAHRVDKKKNVSKLLKTTSKVKTKKG